MIEPRTSRRREPKGIVTRRGLSLSEAEDRKLVELAERHYGGNVSLFIRKLVEKAWEAEPVRDQVSA